MILSFKKCSQVADDLAKSPKFYLSNFFELHVVIISLMLPYAPYDSYILQSIL